MIVDLTVENLAIIEKVHVEFGPGFSVFTGETGAGKSLLVDALELAIGERADTELVRNGAQKAVVNVVFDISKSEAIPTQISEAGIELENSQLFVQRDVALEGRSQCRISGKLTPVATLKQLGRLLVDLHGQHAHQSLLDAEQHLGYLDDWIGAEAAQLKQIVADRYREYHSASQRLSSLQAGVRVREQKLDLLRFQIKDIESVSPKVGELEELETLLSRLKNSEKLASAAMGGLDALSDRENCAIDLVGTTLKAIDSVRRFDTELDPVYDTLAEAIVLLEEAGHTLRSYGESLDADPARLDEVASRLDSLKRLRRKYGENEAQILEFLEKSRDELALLEESDASQEELEIALQKAEAALLKACSNLTELRQGLATDFAKLVQSQLIDLAMDRAVFQASIESKEPDPTGADAVEFFFSANPGEPPRPLAKIASGGEVSRVMLAIKTALAGRAGVPTLIFDEVDSGLGGRAAATMGKKLAELGQHYQVLVISHSPQIAALASRHYHIRKAESNGRIVTDVKELNAKERTYEIARMLAGDQVTESALANAKELLSPSSTLF